MIETLITLWNKIKATRDDEMIALIEQAINEANELIITRNKARDDTLTNPERYAYLEGVEMAYDWEYGRPISDSDVDYVIGLWMDRYSIPHKIRPACEKAFWRGVNSMIVPQEKDFAHISVAMAAERKGVKPETLHAILSDDARRAEIFPNARKTFPGLRAPWELRISEIDAWQPQIRPSRRIKD